MALPGHNVTPMNIPLHDDKEEIASIVAMRFWRTSENVLVSKPGETEKWDTKTHEWVTWAKKGVSIPSTHDEKVARIRKDPVIWRALEHAYNRWKEGGAIDLVNPDHTALDVWAGVTRDEVDLLKQFKVYSVEDFAELTDSAMGRIPMRDMAQRRERARKYLATQATADAVKSHLGDENAALKAQLEEMKAMMAAMQAAVVATGAEIKAPAKGKRAAA